MEAAAAKRGPRAPAAKHRAEGAPEDIKAKTDVDISDEAAGAARITMAADSKARKAAEAKALSEQNAKNARACALCPDVRGLARRDGGVGGRAAGAIVCEGGGILIGEGEIEVVRRLHETIVGLLIIVGARLALHAVLLRVRRRLEDLGRVRRVSEPCDEDAAERLWRDLDA